MSLQAIRNDDALDELRPPVDRADVVYTFSRVTWQAAWRRGFFHSEDRLALSLIDSDRVGRLLICNHSRHAAVKLIRRLNGSDRAPFPAQERINLVQPVSLRRRDPTSVAEVERAYRTYDRALARAVRRHGLRDTHVITGNPMVAGFADLSWAKDVTWYAIDDWSEHYAYAAWSEAFLEAYDRVRDRGRRVAAVSQGLLDRLAPGGPSVVVPNGIDPTEWTGPCSPLEWMAELPRPIYLYVGSLDLRIDVDWVRALAQAEPSSTLLFVGPLMGPDHLAPLNDLPNVRIRPPVERAELRGLIRGADVGLLPHTVTRLTTAMSPLKLLEYLAAGLPVAATDLEPVRSLGHPRVMLASTGDEFVQAGRDAVSVGRAPEPERLRFLDENSWRSRHDRLLDLALS